MMKEILTKISSYDLFNNLLPGVIFSVIIDKITIFNLLDHGVMIVLFISYFIGLIISRIGSLVIEPLLSKMKFIKYAPYAEYLKAEQKDPKIKILLEKNNMYRTMISLLVSILLVKLYEYGTINIEIINKLEVIIIISAIFNTIKVKNI
ncbi:unnamed protein product [marine sediment metagenome]|uniref:Uncharacterized protein n=1 Tax=marine sediment metagenome TaxID=412755 RepID=X1S1P0_9ZZZZ